MTPSPLLHPHPLHVSTSKATPPASVSLVDPPTSSSATSSPRNAEYSLKSLRQRRLRGSTSGDHQQPLSQDQGLSRESIANRKYRNFQSYPRKMSFVKAHYHPFLFALMTMSALAELGLTAFLIGAGNENGTWPTQRYHSLLIMFLFNAIWTTVFSAAYMLWMVDGGSQFLASVASSVIWLLVTTILWGTAAGVMHNTRGGGGCALKPIIHRCRQSLTVEALGWTQFGLCMMTMVLTCLWVKSNNYRTKEENELESSGESTRRLV